MGEVARALIRSAAYIFGALLLLPGACSLVALIALFRVIFMAPMDGGYGTFAFLVWFSGIVLGAAGAGLMYLTREPRRGR